MIPNSIRNFSVKSKTNCTLLCIFGEAYRNAMEVSNAKKLQERVEIIKKIYLFSKPICKFLISYFFLFFQILI